MNVYNPPTTGQKRICDNCRWVEICIGPWDDCELFNVTDENGELLPGKEYYCLHDQGDKNCRKIAAKDCPSFEFPFGTIDSKLVKIKEFLK